MLCRHILSLGAAALLAATLATNAPARPEAGPQTFETSVTGTVNGSAVTGSGLQTLAPDGSFTSRVELVPVPGFHPLATGCALAAMSPGALVIASRAIRDALGARTIREVRRIRVHDTAGKEVGRLTLRLSYGRRAGIEAVVIQLDGRYSGPTDLVFPGSYDMVLAQRGAGRLSGSYTQTVVTSALKPLFVTAESTLFYGTSKVLARPQLLHVRFTDFAFTRGERAVTTVAGRVDLRPLAL